MNPDNPNLRPDIVNVSKETLIKLIQNHPQQEFLLGSIILPSGQMQYACEGLMFTYPEVKKVLKDTFFKETKE